MATAPLGMVSRRDLTRIRNLIIQDRVALERWSMIVDDVVDSEAEALRIKRHLIEGFYEEAVFKTLLFWFSKDAQMLQALQGLVNILRNNFHIALAGKLEEEFMSRMISRVPGDGSNDRHGRLPSVLAHLLHNVDAGHAEHRAIDRLPSASGVGAIAAVLGVPDRQHPPVWFEVDEVIQNFTGRKSQLHQLHTMLADNHSPHQAAKNIVSICGLGGVGKSELARAYVWNYHKFYGGNVMWIHGDTVDSMKDSLTRLAARLDIQLPPKLKNEQIAALVYNNFSGQKCLFVFDYVEEIEDFKQFKPKIQSPNMSTPHVLVTTRIRGLSIPDNELVLTDLNSEEATKFIQNELRLSSAQGASKLAEKLQNFPLAFHQATAYIKMELGEHDGAIEEYVREFDKCALEFLNDVTFTANNEYLLTTFKTWEVTLKRIRGLKNGESALNVINTLSYLDPNRITVKFLTKILGGDVRSSLALLRKYCMIDMPKTRDMVNIHRLVQDVIRLRLAQTSEHRILKDLANAIRLNLVEGKHKITNFLNECLSHGLELFPGRIKNSDFIMGDSSYFSCLWYVYWNLNAHEEFSRCLSYSQHAADVLEVVCGKRHYHTLGMRIWAAISHISLNNKQAARPILNEVVVACESRGEDGYAVFDTLRLMNDAHLLSGNEAKALPLVEQLIALRVETNGDTDENVLLLRSEEAALLANMGRLDEALDLLEDVYQKRLLINGLNDLATLNVKNSIAQVLDMKGERETAKGIRTEIYEVCRGFLGEAHPATVRARKDVGHNFSSRKFVWN